MSIEANFFIIQDTENIASLSKSLIFGYRYNMNRPILSNSIIEMLTHLIAPKFMMR